MIIPPLPSLSQLWQYELNGANVVRKAWTDNVPPTVQWFLNPLDWGGAPDPFRPGTTLPSIPDIVASPSTMLDTAPGSIAESAVSGVTSSAQTIFLVGGVALIAVVLLSKSK